MEGRTVVIAVAALGWLVAGLIAFIFVVWFGFGGIGLIGLMLWFICVRMELEKDSVISTGRATELIVLQHEARQRLSDNERMSLRHEQSLALQSVRFFKHLGMGLTLIGAAGFLYIQL